MNEFHNYDNTKQKLNSKLKFNNLNATQKNIAMGVASFVVACTPIGPVTVLGLIAQPALAATSFTKGRKSVDKIGQGALGLLISFFSIGIGAAINPMYRSDTSVAEVPTPSPLVNSPKAPALKSEGINTPISTPALAKKDRITELQDLIKSKKEFEREEYTKQKSSSSIGQSNQASKHFKNRQNAAKNIQAWQAELGLLLATKSDEKDKTNLSKGQFTTTSHWADAADTSNSGEATYNNESKALVWQTKAFGSVTTEVCTNSNHGDGRSDSGLKCDITTNTDGMPTRAVVTDPSDGYRISTTTFGF